MYSKKELSDNCSIPSISKLTGSPESSSASMTKKRKFNQVEGKQEISFLSGLTETLVQINNKSCVQDHFSKSIPLENSSITLLNNGSDSTFVPDDLIPMNSRFEHENTSHYLYTDEERAAYLVHFNEGKLYNSKNELILNSKLLYVLDKDNNLYAVSSILKWNHSWLLAGSPVKAAGFIETNKKGDILEISNESGHYIPTMLQMLPALRFFLQQIKLSQSHKQSTVIYESHDKAREGVIVSYKLKDIARLNGPQDIHNVLHKLEVLGKQYTKKQELKIIDGYDNELGNSGLAVSRYGLGPKH